MIKEMHQWAKDVRESQRQVEQVLMGGDPESRVRSRLGSFFTAFLDTIHPSLFTEFCEITFSNITEFQKRSDRLYGVSGSGGGQASGTQGSHRGPPPALSGSGNQAPPSRPQAARPPRSASAPGSRATSGGAPGFRAVLGSAPLGQFQS